MSLIVGSICSAGRLWKRSVCPVVVLSGQQFGSSSFSPSFRALSQSVRRIVSLHSQTNARNVSNLCRGKSDSPHGPFFVLTSQYHGLSATSGMMSRRTSARQTRQCVLNLRFIFSEHPKRSNEDIKKRTQSLLLYVLSTGIIMLGASYAGVPLYKMFCQAMGVGGQVSQTAEDAAAVESMERVPHRQITVEFNADVGATMRWQFRPQQSKIKVVPGETALVFYTATNPTDKPIIGISTYSVVPYQAANYFNKIQCFCFEEQILNPFEKVDMPVFFYIDPEFDEDPAMENVDNILLSYTFFEAKEGMTLPYPGFQKPLTQ